MRPKRLTAALGCFALLGVTQAGDAVADHVTADLQASATLGERISDNSWEVIVNWSIGCSGPAPGDARYTGFLYLDDLDTGEVIFLGGTSSASGSERVAVTRRSLPRSMRPRIKSSCFDSVTAHGSDTIEATGNAVTVPGRGDENGDGVPDGAGSQGKRDFPGAGFGGPMDPLRDGGCATVRVGTSESDTLNGTAGADLIFGLRGNDRIRGRGDDDCLIGARGKDRLVGGPGYDRLTGGAGADALIGGAGVNRHDAGAGNDFVDAVNGHAELVSCGSGRDTARVDRSDRVRNCERLTRVR